MSLHVSTNGLKMPMLTSEESIDISYSSGDEAEDLSKAMACIGFVRS